MAVKSEKKDRNNVARSKRHAKEANEKTGSSWRVGEEQANTGMNLPRPSSSGKLGAWTRGATETNDITALV